MMKKIVAFVAAILLLVSMTACAMAATGLGSVTSVSANGATAEATGAVSVTTTMCAVSVDEAGVILSVTFDIVESKGAFDATGAIAGEVNAAPQTKVELGDAYGMKKFSPIGKEWHEQMDALEAWCVGKTVEEVIAYAYDAEKNVDLLAGCTMYVGDQYKALAKAVQAAK